MNDKKFSQYDFEKICLDSLLHEDLFSDLDLAIDFKTGKPCDKYLGALKATAQIISREIASHLNGE